MKKILCLSLMAVVVLAAIAASAEAYRGPVHTEVTGQPCGKYLVLPSKDYTSRNWVTYNLDWDCFCPDKQVKIPIWIFDQDTQEVFMAFTCKRV